MPLVYLKYYILVKKVKMFDTSQLTEFFASYAYDPMAVYSFIVLTHRKKLGDISR